MIQKEKTERRRKGRGRIAAVLAAAMLVSALTVQTGFADPINPIEVLEGTDTIKGGSITVTIPKDPAFDKLRDLNTNGEIAVDLYEVASAKKLIVDGAAYDAYTFDWEGKGFTGTPKAAYDAIQQKSEKKETITAADINGFTQELAKVALGGSVKPVKTGALDGEKGIEVAEGGLYLILVHSTKDAATAYKKDEPGTDTPLTTIVKSSGRQFQFAPMLVSLPTRGMAVVGDDLHVAGEEDWVFHTFGGNTANTSSAWEYNVSLEAKAAVGAATGRLQITKNLQNYETMANRTENVTFIYSITARENGQVIYSDVASVVLNAAGSGSTLVTGIPVGAEVTVEEIYKGGDYTQTRVSPEGPLVVVPYDPETNTDEGTMASITFTNTHDGNGHKGGGSVKNTYGAASTDQGTTWSWNSTPQQTSADDSSTN